MKLILVFILGLAFGAPTTEEMKETKVKVQQELEQGFEDLKVQVKELQDKAAKSSGEIKKDLQSQIASLQKDQKEVQAQLQKLKSSSGEAWQDVKAGASSAYEKFKNSVNQAKERFKEKK